MNLWIYNAMDISTPNGALPIQTLYIQQIQEEIQLLSVQLLHVLEHWHNVYHIQRNELLDIYDARFGTLEKEIQLRTFLSAEIHRRVEILSIKSERGEKLTDNIISAVNTFVDKEFQRLKERQFSSADTDKFASAEMSGSQDVNNAELPKMYRILVKKLHPDSRKEKMNVDNVWDAVQNAYVQRDIQKIRALYSVLCESESTDIHDISEQYSLEALQNRKIELQKRIDYEERKIARLLHEEPFSIAEKLRNEEWKNGHEKALRKQIASIDRDIATAESRYAALTGKNPPTIHSNSNTAVQTDSMDGEGNKQYDSEFQQQTYFGNR